MRDNEANSPTLGDIHNQAELAGHDGIDAIKRALADDQYTPSADLVRKAYIATICEKHDDEALIGAEFDRWVTTVRADAIDAFADIQVLITRLHDYAMDEGDWDEHNRLVASLKNYSAVLRKGGVR